jgi:hypothetical protein
MKTTLALLGLGILSAGALAAGSDIRVSTDPAKIAAVEQHAKELQARGHEAPAHHGAKKSSPAHGKKPAAKSAQTTK